MGIGNFVANILTAPSGKTHIFSVGQSGYIIKSAMGQLLAIDLYLSECVERVEGHIGFKRLLPKILSPFDLTFDAVIATHPHRDHFDIDSIPEMVSNKETILLASKECRVLVQNLEMLENNVEYVVPGDTYTIGDFKINIINCDHGEGAPDAVGVVVEVDNKIILETGDTCLRLDRIEEYSSFGNIDVMIAPINGRYGNLSEKDCVILSKELNPQKVIPCHYGMFASHHGDVGTFYELMKENNMEDKVALLAQGQKLTL